MEGDTTQYGDEFVITCRIPRPGTGSHFPDTAHVAYWIKKMIENAVKCEQVHEGFALWPARPRRGGSAAGGALLPQTPADR